jgi:hypothetical protein
MNNQIKNKIKIKQICIYKIVFIKLYLCIYKILVFYLLVAIFLYRLLVLLDEFVV